MNDLPWIEIVYWVATIIGGTLFVLRTILLVIGGGFGGDDFEVDDIDVDPDFDVDHDIEADHSGSFADSDFSFKLLSTQGITAFFMMFGLVGLAFAKANALIIVSLLGATAAGLFSVWVISILFMQMKRLQSDGSINIQNALGQNGSVYLKIPSNGTGQVQITIQGALKIFDAYSEDKETINTGEKISVTKIIDHNTLGVKKI